MYHYEKVTYNLPKAKFEASSEQKLKKRYAALPLR